MKYVKFILETGFKILIVVLLKVRGFSDSLNHMAPLFRRLFIFNVWSQDFIAIIMRKLQTGLPRNCGSILVRTRKLFLSSPPKPNQLWVPCSLLFVGHWGFFPQGWITKGMKLVSYHHLVPWISREWCYTSALHICFHGFPRGQHYP